MGLFASVAGQLSARAQGAEGGDGGLQVEFSTLEEAQAAAAALRAKSGDFTGLLLDQPVNLVEPDLPKPDSAAEFTVKVFTEVFESGNIGAIPQAIGYSIGEFQDAFGQSVEEGTLPWDQIGLVFLVFVVLANSTTVIFPFLEEALAPDEAPVTSYPTRVAKADMELRLPPRREKPQESPREEARRIRKEGLISPPEKPAAKEDDLSLPPRDPVVRDD
eukprot:CAMPEP_0115089190 /NCGR_PEP_ID=MMETSP0227-20121206/24503_1 /TAXON_ID=89957 /ORGANISM="Polarella glacialis, Strain CCMP 1383" /LENGTH=217 /DNA_ID=CAMNT_0002479731 /DNA_START=222 /DNA_END=872 /DNA_ORIENTATION=-